MIHIEITDLDKLYYAKLNYLGRTGKLIANVVPTDREASQLFIHLLKINTKKVKVAEIIDFKATHQGDFEYLLESMEDYLGNCIMYMIKCPDGYSYEESFYRIRDYDPKFAVDMYVLKNSRSIVGMQLYIRKIHKRLKMRGMNR